MTLYYSLVFALLVFEMALFVTLVIPLPHKMKVQLFNFISQNPLVAKLQYGLKITFIFITILFIDSVNRVYRVQLEMAAFNTGGDVNIARAAAIGTDRQEVQARKFYSQRNMYLTGFTLFLSLILNRYYIMILETLRLEDKVMKYEGGTSSKASQKLSVEGTATEIANLKRDLEKEKKDKEGIKRQADNLQKEYDDLMSRYTNTNPGDRKGQ